MRQSRFDPLCFHAQQCVEKYLKGVLTEAEIPFFKTHDLTVVLNLALTVHPLWSAFLPSIQAISDWAVLPRYPGTSATAPDAREAVKVCRRFRTDARAVLGI